jgi:hypothetical protein
MLHTAVSFTSCCTAKKTIATFRHLDRMTQDQTVRLTENVFNKHVGLFLCAMSSMSEKSYSVPYPGRLIPTVFYPS